MLPYTHNNYIYLFVSPLVHAVNSVHNFDRLVAITRVHLPMEFKRELHIFDQKLFFGISSVSCETIFKLIQLLACIIIFLFILVFNYLFLS